MIASIVRDGNWPDLGIEWTRLLPVVVVLAGAVLATLVEAIARDSSWRKTAQVIWALVVVAMAGLIAGDKAVNAPAELAARGTYLADQFTSFMQLAIAVAAFLALLVMADRSVQGEDAFSPQVASIPGSAYEEQARKANLVLTDVYPLALFSIGGMMLFPAAGDLITLFVALEVMSLPLYLLAGMARRRRLLSQEAAFKYYVMGALSSGIFLFGAAWLYGATGQLRLVELFEAVRQDPLTNRALLLTGLTLLLIGLLFKVGAAPFHSWTPDVYQGAPSPVTGFMAACTKVAAFGALIRILYGLQVVQLDLKAMLWTVSIVTMVVGTVVGVVQKDVKRLLAYSAIAHAGFILAGVVSFSHQGMQASMFYLFTYAVSTVGAFGVITLVREVDSQGHVRSEATGLDQWRGLGRRSPVLAGAFSVFLLAFAGIPFTAGFVGKFAVFAAAFGAGAWVLGVVGLACSAAAAFFYARVIVAMFFSGEPGDVVTGGVGCGVRTTGLTQLAIALSLAFTLVVGVVPGWLLNFAASMAKLLTG